MHFLTITNMCIRSFLNDGRNGDLNTQSSICAIAAHQYKNRFLSDSCFLWTNQNQMKPSNLAGLKVLVTADEKRTLRLFVQPKSHTPALYVGRATVLSFEGSGPMQIELKLERSIPHDVLIELGSVSIA